jgi:hypothetical protein
MCYVYCPTLIVGLMRTETLTPQPRSFDLSFSLFLADIRKRVSEILPQRQAETASKTYNFELIDILAEYLAEQQQREAGKPFNSYIVNTLQTQLGAALREHLKLPFHEDYSIVDLSRFAENTLHISHPGYRDVDLLEYFEKASSVARSEAESVRYRRETNQFRLLYARLWDDLTASTEPAVQPDGRVNLPQWESALAADVLPPRVSAEMGVSAGERVFVQRKHALALPQNKEVYGQGQSYLNVYQLVYLPQKQQVVLVTNHLYRPIDPATQHGMLRSITEEVLPDVPKNAKSDSLEEILLNTVVTLPEALRTTSTTTLFLQLLQERSHLSEGGPAVELEQKRVTQKFLGSASNLNRAVAFLTQVLIAEHAMCRDYPASTSGLLDRLHLAMEMVFNPLFSGVEMNVAASKKVYMDLLFKNRLSPTQREGLKNKPVRAWLSELPQAPESEVAPRTQYLQRQVVRLQKESRHFDGEQYVNSDLRTQAVLQLSTEFPNILKRVTGEAACAAGSFGGLSQKFSSVSGGLSMEGLPGMNGLSFKGFESLISSGPLRDRSVLEQMVGRERAQLFTMGKCVYGEHCYFPGVEQLVGECSVCALCEKMPRHTFDMLKNQDNLQEWFQQDQASGSDAVETGRSHWNMPATDFLPYMLSERAVSLR